MVKSICLVILQNLKFIPSGYDKFRKISFFIQNFAIQGRTLDFRKNI